MPGVENWPTQNKEQKIQDIYLTEKKKVSEAMIKNGFMDGEVSAEVIKVGKNYELYIKGTRYNKSEDPIDNFPTIGAINIKDYGEQDFSVEELKKIADKQLQLLLDSGSEDYPMDKLIEEATGRKSNIEYYHDKD